jgi:hypothetical protein
MAAPDRLDINPTVSEQGPDGTQGVSSAAEAVIRPAMMRSEKSHFYSGNQAVDLGGLRTSAGLG